MNTRCTCEKDILSLRLLKATDGMARAGYNMTWPEWALVYSHGCCVFIYPFAMYWIATINKRFNLGSITPVRDCCWVALKMVHPILATGASNWTRVSRSIVVAWESVASLGSRQGLLCQEITNLRSLKWLYQIVYYPQSRALVTNQVGCNISIGSYRWRSKRWGKPLVKLERARHWNLGGVLTTNFTQTEFI
jgi:hypothetical protein